jgi:GT2 family glycosyltransferase
MVKTAVVILNWNGINWLMRFLETVVKYSAGSESVIYLADNGSSDGSADWVSNKFTNVRIIRLDTNYGFAEGYNRALEQIKAKYFVLLNSDMEVTEGWLEPMVKFMDQNPDVASCQPKIKSFCKRDHFEYAGAAGGFIDKYGYTFCRGRIFEHIEKDYGQYDNCTDIFWSSGACMMVRSIAWKESGGFDGDFFAHMEEVDLCWRFYLAGLRVSFIPGSTVFHVGGGMLPYDSKLKTYLNFRNNLMLLYKNLPDNKLHLTLFIRKILDGAALTRFLVSGKPENAVAVMKAHCDYYKSLRSLKIKREYVKKMATGKTGYPIVNMSIVFRFYLKGQKNFRNLNI